MKRLGPCCLHYILLGMKPILVCLVISILLLSNSALAAPIYVIKEASGVIRFSTKPPKPGVKADIFTAKGARYSVLGSSLGWNGRLFHNRFNDHIIRASKRFEIDPALVKAVIHAESSFNPKAVSPKGALGLMQLMPATARFHGVKQPFEPSQNIEAGTRHLAQLLKKYKGNLRFALAAYNAGEEAVNQYGGVPPFSETQDYVHRVINLRTRYRSAKVG